MEGTAWAVPILSRKVSLLSKIGITTKILMGLSLLSGSGASYNSRRRTIRLGGLLAEGNLDDYSLGALLLAGKGDVYVVFI